MPGEIVVDILPRPPAGRVIAPQRIPGPIAIVIADRNYLPGSRGRAKVMPSKVIMDVRPAPRAGRVIAPQHVIEAVVVEIAYSNDLIPAVLKSDS